MKNLILALSGLFALSTVGFSNTIWVPDDHPTIQEAIDAAVDGNEVVVRPGTYVENIDFIGKAITVRSELWPEVTTIDGNQAGCVVRFALGEGPGSVLEGFTITNGLSSTGGGIHCRSSSPTTTGNVISGNRTGGSGTGLGGVGGGNYCGDSAATIVGNTIVGNTAECSLHCSAVGGGIACWGSQVILTNNTIAGNWARMYGGICCSGGHVTTSNTILWDNGGSGSEISCWGGTFTISYSDLEGGLSSIDIDHGGTLNWGYGSIDADPLFTDPANGDYRLQQDPSQPGVTNPWVDAGDPLSPMITGTTRTDLVQDSGIVDMGYHYEITSIPGVPYCYGDSGSGTPCPSLNGAAGPERPVDGSGLGRSS